MATLDKFYLSEFSAQGDEILPDIPVCIPRTAFRIHPHKSHMHKGVVLKRSDDNWYLIHPDVVREGRLSGLWLAALYEGVKSNGASFVLPLTDARPGREDRYDSMKEAIDEARQGWVTIESVADQDCWVITPQSSRKLQSQEPKWFDGEFSELIETAFRGRVIRTQQQASALFRKTSRREISEDE